METCSTLARCVRALDHFSSPTHVTVWPIMYAEEDSARCCSRVGLTERARRPGLRPSSWSMRSSLVSLCAGEMWPAGEVMPPPRGGRIGRLLERRRLPMSGEETVLGERSPDRPNSGVRRFIALLNFFLKRLLLSSTEPDASKRDDRFIRTASASTTSSSARETCGGAKTSSSTDCISATIAGTWWFMRRTIDVAMPCISVTDWSV